MNTQTRPNSNIEVWINDTLRRLRYRQIYAFVLPLETQETQVYIGINVCDAIPSMCNETHITCRTRASYSGETTPLQVSVALFKPTGEALSIPAENFFRGCKIPGF